MPDLLDQLAGGDPLTLGRTAAVAASVLAQPELIDALFDGVADDDEAIRNRSMDALERISSRRPELLRPYKRELLTRVVRIGHWSVRSHLCQVLARLDNYTPVERRRAITTVGGWLHDRSSIVKAVALDCAVQLSLAPGFAPERAAATRLVNECVQHGGTPALRARARKLQRQLAKLAPPARA
ncbi:hypothetical protein Verru16b_00951 [Lacunisphaera limnophila]|uniref:HEAT repeat protein n=1 Tax=Lacunisphaera limnophila TaxID=1838286 RepID=A0A1D8ASM8_9BACT|nr:hypothetical protein [Lacunisphaera limnophila]AOS43893.1 hypothetical protein Verru16b_00951 [Lacunisphaera limnophila]